MNATVCFVLALPALAGCETLPSERAALDGLYREREESLHTNYITLEKQLKDDWAHRQLLLEANASMYIGIEEKKTTLDAETTQQLKELGYIQ